MIGEGARITTMVRALLRRLTTMARSTPQSNVNGTFDSSPLRFQLVGSVSSAPHRAAPLKLTRLGRHKSSQGVGCWSMNFAAMPDMLDGLSGRGLQDRAIE